MNSISTHKNFLSKKLATNLRSEFVDVYKDPRKTPPERFVWDHWHLENQYRLHRTLAQSFFSEKSYVALKNALVSFGQNHLGCHSISEPWLSYYTEGDEQQLHTDSPHGPWAYVLSLTPWQQRKFSGGETLVLRPEILNYWENYSTANIGSPLGKGRKTGLEFSDINLVVPALFNQLLVFDPRLPHGVRRVTGTHDPLESRLVVHGWFVNPEPFVIGGLKMSRITGILNKQIQSLFTDMTIPENIFGILTLQLQILPSGRIASVKTLTNTLVGSASSLTTQISNHLKKLQLPAAKTKSTLTLPLIFD